MSPWEKNGRRHRDRGSALGPERAARAGAGCPETLAAISFGRHHRLRGRGAEDRESAVPAAPSVATQPTRVSSKRVPFLRMGFFSDKSGNPAYILAEKVRRRGGHARLSTPRAVTARARPRPTGVCRAFRPRRLVSPRERNASFARSESRRPLEETHVSFAAEKKVPNARSFRRRFASFAPADRAMPPGGALALAALTPRIVSSVR